MNCSARSSDPQPSTYAVDIERDIQIIPKDGCEAYAGWIGRTVEAERQRQLNAIGGDATCRQEVASAVWQSKRFMERASAAEKQRDAYGWRAEYGFPLGFGVGGTVAAVLVIIVESLLRR